MKCIKCGKEIPDGSEYCGYCGAKQNPEKEEEKEVIEEKKEETVESSETTEETLEEPTEEKPVEEDTTDEPVDAEFKPAEKKPEESKKEDNLEAIKNTAKETAAKVKDVAVDQAAKAKKVAAEQAEKVDWNEFNVILEILKDPFGNHPLNTLPAWCVAVVTLITNWMMVHTFTFGLLLTLVVYGGTYLLVYLTRDKKMSGGELFGVVSQMLVVPVVFAFVGSLIGIRCALSALYGEYGAMFFKYFLILISFIALVLDIEKTSTKKMNAYLLIILFSVLFVVLLFFWVGGLETYLENAVSATLSEIL